MKTKSTLFCLVFAFCTNTSIISFAQPGTLDLSFGNRGKVAQQAVGDYSGYFHALAIQDNGKFLVAGSGAFSSSYWIFLDQLNRDGTLDKRAFGPDFPSDDSWCRAMAIQSDGKILIAGGFYNVGNTDFLLLRYNKTTLSLDSSFSSDGIVSTDIGKLSYDESSSLAIQKDGKIILAGTSSNGSNSNFALVRYKTNGSLDKTFGTGGKVVTDISPTDDPSSVAIQADGKIIVAGSVKIGSTYGYALVRYNINGSLDNAFGSDGKITTALGNPNAYERLPSLAIQTDGKILVAGSSYNGSISCVALLRYNRDGSLDNSFGKSGKVITHIGDLGSEGNALAIQQDGKILVAGTTRKSSNVFPTYDNHFAKIIYNANGSYDNTFSYDGQVTTNILKNNEYRSGDYGRAVARQADGKIVVAGTSFLPWNDGFPVYSLVRYNGDKTASMLNTSISQNASSLLTPTTKGFFIVYPNPAKDILHVQTGDKAIVSLTDQSGKILFTKSIEGNEVIRVASLPAGLYYLKNVSTGVTQKVIITK